MDDAQKLRKVLEKLQAIKPVSMEELLCGKDYFNLATATPLQRAICRIVDGHQLGSLANHGDVVAAVGTEPAGKPIELDILSGIRAGKSLFVAALAIHWTQTCDISKLGPGEVARVSVVSLKVDLANVVFNHIVGNINASPKLRALLVEPPSADGVVLRHPSSRPVEIKVVAGTRAGASLVSRWSAGCIFDEYTRMVGSEEGVVNYEDSRAAVLGRLLPGAQIASIGSPWASTGPAYSRYVQYWGQPQGAVVVVKAPGWAMNPVFWTPERCERLKKEAPDVYRTDCAAEFSSPEDAFFTAEEVRLATRVLPVLQPEPGAEYVAAMDPASRSNSWTLVVATKLHGILRVVLATQWTGSQAEPLRPSEVLEQIRIVLEPYGVRTVMSDLAMGDALKDLAGRAGLNLHQVQLSQQKRYKLYTDVKVRLANRILELPPCKELREDLLRVRKRITPAGAAAVLPETNDGRHCDYVPSLVLALSRWLNEPAGQADSSDEARLRRELKATVKRLQKRYGSSTEGR